jgi:protein-S-isoprenylcysteine O-methyltransferase Ste14
MMQWLVSHHTELVLFELAMGLVTLIALRIINAPYGRHLRSGWGPKVSNRTGWMLMEFPSAVFFLWIYAAGSSRWDTIPLLLLAVWQTHYVYRAFIFPFRVRSGNKEMPVVIALIAIVFNTLNSAVNATWVSTLGSQTGGFTASLVALGLSVTLIGWVINHHSDQILFDLRKPGETGYKIPRRGLFRWVSAPNYLGEIMIWAGWAIACMSWAGLAFLLFTIANLLPRALDNHQWYQDTFSEYPPERKAIFPFVL